ncbi:hypothetical protein Nepgr_033732 [Nepenthes gracilis]|uniref:Uncharacterized protein n=1 Tax=Nepenthes gracilis TaxID=150966 RepID=A0AAD3Y757_NEPGR|nr:hypothetical protein Nepgr_033732 [Nepenthes gracilis]
MGRVEWFSVPLGAGELERGGREGRFEDWKSERRKSGLRPQEPESTSRERRARQRFVGIENQGGTYHGWRRRRRRTGHDDSGKVLVHEAEDLNFER